MLQHTLRDWRDRLFWLLLFLSLVVLFCVYQITLPSPLFINLGTEGDERYLRNFNLGEQGGLYPFRWTRDSSYIKIPNLGSLPLEITLGADAARPEGQPVPRVSVIANGAVLADFTMQNGIWAHQFLYHSPLFPLPKDLLLEIKSDTFVPSGDEYRALGILLNTVEVKPIISPLRLLQVSLMASLTGSLSIAFNYLLLRWLGVSQKKSLVCGIVVLALLGLGIVRQFIVARFLMGVFGLLLVGYVLALLLEAKGYREPLITRLGRKTLETWAGNLISTIRNPYPLYAEIKHGLDSFWLRWRLMINQWLGTRKTRVLFVLTGLSLVLLGLAILGNGWVDNLLLSVMLLWKGKPPALHWIDKLHMMLGVEALLSGVLMVAFGWLILPRRPLVISSSQKEYFLVVAAISVLLLSWFPYVFIGPSATIAGERYWWLSDDAMISMRYARNLANGVGLVWNPGERVEGYSNFLWTIYVALVHLFPIPASKTSLVVILTNIALAVATIPVLVRLVRILGGSTLATITALGGYVLNQSVMGWAIAGFETPLLIFLLILAMYRGLYESQLNQPRLPTYLLIAAISLVRADAIVLSALLYTISLLLNKIRKTVLIYSLISLLLPIAHEIFRIYYYGDILPNTAYLKVMNWNGRYVGGLEYVLDFAKHYAFPIAFAIVGSMFSRDLPRRSLLGVFVLYTAYVVCVGGDAALQYFRFFVPVLPLLMVLAFLGIQNLVLRQTPRLAISILCLVTMPLIISHYTAVFSSRQNHGLGNARIGLMLKQNTPTTSKVADFWAGSGFYFSERYGIDLLGKSDRHVAHLAVTSNEAHPGHNKFDFDYSLGVLKPDFVIANFELPVDEDEMRRKATGDWAFTGQLYLNPVFREHCLPNPVIAETWRTVFVCDWSSQLEKRDEWKELPLER